MVDNADDAQAVFGSTEIPTSSSQYRGIWQYLPWEDKGRMVLFTTRFWEIAWAAANSGRNVLKLGVMSKEEAIQLLRSLIHKDEGDSDDFQTNGAELVRELECLPAAIKVAAGYIVTNYITVGTYLEHLQHVGSYNSPLLQGAIVTTWAMSIDRIGQSEHDSDQAAIELLAFVSLIEPKDIPGRLFPSLGGQQRQRSALWTLCRYGFLSNREKSNIFDTRKQVQMATQMWLEGRNELESQREQAIRHLCQVFPKPYWENYWTWRPLLPHAMHILRESKGNYGVERATLLARVGDAFKTDSRWSEAIECYEELSLHKPEVNHDEPTFELCNNLAWAYRHLNRHKEALELLTTIVDMQKELWPEDHPLLLASQAHLGEVYCETRKRDQGIELLTSIIERQRKIH